MTTEEMSKEQLIEIAKEELRKKKVRDELPHLFSFKPYLWTLQYWNSTSRKKFICAANQISKSSSQIRHAIDLATDKEKWPKFFPKRIKENQEPKLFWYVYPSKTKAQEEIREKWEKEFLPRGEMKDDPVYGWKYLKDDGDVTGIQFHSGVTLMFKGWAMDLQAGTCDAIFIDEELQSDLFFELERRLTRYDGFLSMVFTATIGQPFFYDIMERIGKRGERYTDASKWVISMEHDCEFYADGSPSPWTKDEVQRQKNKIGDPAEIDKRIHGRFVQSSGRKFKSFHKSRNVIQKSQIPIGWYLFSGVDIGTGGPDAHKSAISIIAVRPDYQYGKLIRFWRGPDDETTDSTAVVNKWIELTAGLNMTANYYDWHNKEFYLRTLAAGLCFEKAEKAQEFGTDLLNTLFKNKMLDIEEGEDIDYLITEFETLKSETSKSKAVDDCIDSLRYAASKVSWDFSNITSNPILMPEKEDIPDLYQSRMQGADRLLKEDEKALEKEWDFDQEIEDYNDLLEM